VTSPAELETQYTLRTAVARYEELRTRDVLAGSASQDAPVVADAEALSPAEVLELLALGEVIARKAGYGRQLSVRGARAAGASWTAIGRALGTTKQAAWEAHSRWIEGQSADHAADGYSGMDDAAAVDTRRLAGSPDDEP
jgi:hypothetical protein